MHEYFVARLPILVDGVLPPVLRETMTWVVVGSASCFLEMRWYYRVYLSVKSVSEWLCEHIPVSFTIGNVVSETYGDCIVISRYQSISLRMICGRDQPFETYIFAFSVEALACKMRTVFGQYMVQFTEKSAPVVWNDVR